MRIQLTYTDQEGQIQTVQADLDQADPETMTAWYEQHIGYVPDCITVEFL